MSLAVKLILIFLLVSLAPMGAVAFLVYTKGTEAVEQQAVYDLRLTNRLTEGSLLVFFDKIKTRATDWAGDGYILSEANAIFTKTDSDRSRQLGEYIKTKKHSTDPAVLITDILDRFGKIVASSDQSRVGGSLLWKQSDINAGDSKLRDLQSLSFVNHLKFGEAAVSEMSFAPGMPELPLISVVSPLAPSSSAEVTGFLVNHLLNKELNRILSGRRQVELGANASFLGGTQAEELYLVNRDGYMITPSRYEANTIFKNKLETPAVQACAKEKKEFVGRYKNYLNAPVVGVALCEQNQWWTLVGEISEKEAFAGVNQIKKIIYIFIIPAMLAAALIGWVFSRQLLGRSSRNLKVLKELGEENYNARAEIFGNDVFTQTGQEINKLAARLQQLLLKIKK